MLKLTMMIAVLGAVTLAVMLAGCSGEPDPAPAATQTAVPEPSPTATQAVTATPSAEATTATTPTATPPATPAPTSAAGVAPVALGVDIDADTTWQELFDALSNAEQSCIRDALGGELAQTLTQPILSEDFTEGVETSIFPCLEAGTANAVFASVTIVAFEQDLGELSEQDKSCLRVAVSGFDVGTFVASGEDPPDEFSTGMFSCVSNMIVAPLMFGLSPDDLTEEEESCLREAVSGPDVNALMAFEEDPPEELMTSLFSCVSQPSAEAGPPLSLDEYAAWCADTSHMGQVSMVDGVTYGEAAAEMAETIAAAKAVSPPSEVSDWHARNVLLLRALMGILDTQPQDEVLDQSVFFEVLFAAALLEEAAEGMDADVRDRLKAAGCMEDLTIEVQTEVQAVVVQPVPIETVTTADVHDDHGNDIDNATAISVGESVEGVLQSREDRDIFRFTAEAGRFYRLDMTSGADFFQAEVYRHDPECWDELCIIAGLHSGEATEFQDSPASGYSWQADETRDYYVVVQGFEPHASYNLSITEVVDDHANTIAGATAVAVGTPVESVIDWGDDVDYFRFTAQEGQTYNIEVALDTLSESWMRLLSSDGEELAEDPWEEGILWSAPQSGDYYVEVKGGFWGGETGAYTLTVTAAEDDRGAVLPDDDDHGDSRDTATTISVGETVGGIISDDFDNDWFVFNAEAGKEYRVFVTHDTLEWSFLRLHSSDSQLVETPGDSRLTWQAPDSGAYYVEVVPFLNPGTYALTVGEDDYGDSLTDATSITVGQPVEGALGFQRDGDVFAFQTEVGQTVQFEVTLGTLASFDLSVWTSDSGWTKLDQPSWESTSSYEVYVAMWSSAGDTGTYTLTIVVH